MISPKPNTPMAMTTKLMPSVSSGKLKSVKGTSEKRGTPEITSVLIWPSSRPSRIMAMALISEPEASTTAPIRPSTMSEKYSAGPNLKASSVSGGAKPAITSVATVPAKNEPSPAAASAGPARPMRAIW